MTSTRIAPIIALFITLLVCAPLLLAGTPVDPSTLNPPPAARTNAVCERDGSQIICTLQFTDPPFAGGTGVICGSGASAFEPFQFSNRSVQGKRYYDQNGNLLVRHFREVLDGTFTNPITHKSLAFSGGDTDLHRLAVPGDVSSGTEAVTRSVRIFLGQGNGTMAIDTGRLVDSPQGLIQEAGQHPFFDYFGGDTAAMQPLCDALQ